MGNQFLARLAGEEADVILCPILAVRRSTTNATHDVLRRYVHVVSDPVRPCRYIRTSHEDGLQVDKQRRVYSDDRTFGSRAVHQHTKL